MWWGMAGTMLGHHPPPAVCAPPARRARLYPKAYQIRSPGSTCLTTGFDPQGPEKEILHTWVSLWYPDIYVQIYIYTPQRERDREKEDVHGQIEEGDRG